MRETGYDTLAHLLREMAERFGDTAFSDRRRLCSLLADRMPEARGEIRVVGAAVDERVFEALFRTPRDQLDLEVERLAAKLESGLAIRHEVAMPVIQACAYGLSLGPLPSMAGCFDPVGALSPRGGTPSDWVGFTQPVIAAGPTAPPPVPDLVLPAVKVGGGRWMRWLLIGPAGLVCLIVLGFATGVIRQLPDATPPPPVQQLPQPVQPTPIQLQPVQPTPVQPQPALPQPVQPLTQQPQPPRVYAQETVDFHVPPQATLRSEVGSATPLSGPGMHTVNTTQLSDELRSGHRMILIDALMNQHAQTIPAAVHLAYSGQYGTFNDQLQAALANDLARLTQGHREIPLVFFCLGPYCWESYNAALRARAAGYPNVYWYRGGLQAWQEADLPMQASN